MFKSHLIISLGLVLAATFNTQAASDIVILDETAVRNLRIETVTAEYQDFETSVFAIGRIEEIPANRSVLSSRIAGRVTELHAFVGDTVDEGQLLAKVESRLLGDPPPTIELKAPQRGIIIDSHVRLGQPVEPDADLLDISDRSQVWAIAKIPETEAAQVDIGSLAHIRIPALGSEAIDATLVRFGVNADRQAGTIDGIFQIDNESGKLRPGMRVEFSIVLNRRSNILSVPRKSIQGDPANRVVFVKDFDLANAFVKAPVVLGESNDAYVEVLSGLFPGDDVVTQGSYALGFVGGNAGISLKEALDAAHGHEHNEDGSEMTLQQRHDDRQEDNPNSPQTSRALLVYAAIMTLAAVVLAQLLWSKGSVRRPGGNSTPAKD